MKLRKKDLYYFNRTQGAVVPVFAAILLVIVILATGLINRWIDSVETYRGQSVADAVALYSLPVVVPPEYIAENADTSSDPIATEQFLQGVADANGFDERFLKPVSDATFEIVPGTFNTEMKVTFFRQNESRNNLIGHVEGVPGAKIREGFMFHDYSRNLTTPLGRMPIALHSSQVAPPPQSIFLAISTDLPIIGSDPVGELNYLAGNPGNAPDACYVGQPLLPFNLDVLTTTEIIIGLQTLIGKIAIFPVIDDGQVVGFARVKIGSFEPPVIPVLGIPGGTSELILAPTAVSPAAVRGDGYPADIPVPELVEYGQVLRARTAN